MMRKLVVWALVFAALGLVAVVVALPTLAAANPQTSQQPPEPQSPDQPDALPVFEAILSGANEVPAVGTNATGRAVLVLDDDLSTVYYRVRVSSIDNVTAANIYFGQPGENGTLAFSLLSSGDTLDPDNPISGTLTLSPTQVTELMVGNYYINIHTSDFPDGETRGQIEITSPTTTFTALLNGANEVPPVDTPASGVAHFNLNPSLDSLDFEIEVSDIISITAAHLHPGLPGQEGPPAVTLYDGTGVFDPSNPLTGTAALSPQNLLDLLTGFFYVNVHTEANPEGEIRGQVGTSFHTFEANLNGANEVPPVTTDATGRAVMVLDKDLSTLHYRVVISDIVDVTAAHIHIGQPGEAGPVVFPLFTGSGTFDPDNPISGTLTLTSTEQVNDLTAGNYYVNVHTDANPDGEIRGQLEEFEPPSSFLARLSGNEEVPLVYTDATGLGLFNLNEEMDTLHYRVTVHNIEDITLAQIYQGVRGTNGTPVITLFDGTGTFDPLNPISGSASLTAQNLLDLITGYLYVNVHTQTNPSGEIRGQIQETSWIQALPILLREVFLGPEPAQ